MKSSCEFTSIKKGILEFGKANNENNLNNMSNI